MFDSMRRARAREGTESHFSFGSGPVGDTGHLATEAIAAYVDGELRMSAHMRASAHLSRCSLCAAEVDAQVHARKALQASDAPQLPEDLLGDLRSIPQTVTPAADPPDSEGDHRHRRRRLP